MAQLRLAEEKDERRRSTGTWDAANVTCFTLLTSPTYCGSFLKGSLKVLPASHRWNSRKATWLVHTFVQLFQALWINFCQIHDMMLKYYARYEEVFQLSNVSHFIGPLSLTLHDHTVTATMDPQKKKIQKLFSSIFANFPASRTWSTSALRQLLFVYLQNFKQSFSGFPSTKANFSF